MLCYINLSNGEFIEFQNAGELIKYLIDHKVITKDGKSIFEDTRWHPLGGWYDSNKVR